MSTVMAFFAIVCYHGNMKLLNNMKKNACLFGFVFIACISILSCVSTGMNAEPEYLLKAKRDNGFISAYKAHFALDGESLYKISERRYEDLTLGEDSKYKMIGSSVVDYKWLKEIKTNDKIYTLTYDDIRDSEDKRNEINKLVINNCII